ncbi:DUF1580 domain-containing protein [Planctellipticum variicoloris]|uniref:DUF1580 domain-containing protein n=1 Tax=Planctellipticum variicoloris TaxID=3064265 RepID=UPI0030133055|nr:DUF1580 domain-containing protein [Planctomycetaceae bacterium SH412]
MISPTDVYNAVPVPEVPALFPGRPSIATVWRWILNGVRGPNGETVRLESFKCGGRRFVQRDAIDRFIAAWNAEPTAKPPVRDDDAVRRARDAAKALEALGA